MLAAFVAGLVPAAAATAARPTAIQMFVNGKRVPLQPIIGGSDDYAQLHAKTMLVEARWTGDAGGSGTFIRLSTDEPKEKVYATCTTGTTCKIPHAVRLGIDVETSWHVELVSTHGHKVLAGYKYCLVRYE